MNVRDPERVFETLRVLREGGRLKQARPEFVLQHGPNTVRVPVLGGLDLHNLAKTDAHLVRLLEILLPLRAGAFVDVGAHQAQTLLKLLAVAPERPYIGFEPQPRHAAYVRSVLEHNRRSSGTVVAAALGDQCRLVRLRLPADDSSASAVEGFRPQEFYRETLWVPMLRADQAVRDVLHHGQRPAIVKIDVEGGELEVLEGLERILRQDRPFVLCEVLPVQAFSGSCSRFRRRRIDRLERFLAERRYRLYRVPVEGSVVPLDRLETHSDLSLRDHLFVPAEDAATVEAALSVGST